MASTSWSDHAETSRLRAGRSDAEAVALHDDRLWVSRRRSRISGRSVSGGCRTRSPRLRAARPVDGHVGLSEQPSASMKPSRSVAAIVPSSSGSSVASVCTAAWDSGLKCSPSGCSAVTPTSSSASSIRSRVASLRVSSRTSIQAATRRSLDPPAHARPVRAQGAARARGRVVGRGGAEPARRRVVAGRDGPGNASCACSSLAARDARRSATSPRRPRAARSRQPRRKPAPHGRPLRCPRDRLELAVLAGASRTAVQ